MTVNDNLIRIEEKINEVCLKTNRNREDITIIGVTKYVTIERTQELLETGMDQLGENRVEGFQMKFAEFENQATWHFIGTLQSRKVKDVINQIDVLHSLERLSVAKQIQMRRTAPIDCFIQVNVSGEVSKHGLTQEEVIPFIESLQAYENIRVCGLMTMAPDIQDKEEIRRVFRSLRLLRETIREKHFAHAPCEYLSMGMSNDYDIAIEEGATHIRLGSTLVG